MKKLFNKFFAGAITLVLVATAAFGVSFANNAKASNELTLSTWTFEQGGQYNPGEPGNEGYINKVTMNGTSEVVDGWTTGAGSKEQTQSANEVSDGFTLGIDNTGWDALWKVNTGAPVTTINPWSIQAWVNAPMVADEDNPHTYKVSFKAKASRTKNAYITFKTVVNGQEMNPYDTAPMEEGSSLQFVAFGTTEKTYTYIFKNYVGGTNLKTNFMLGAFTADEDNGKLYDYGQNDISDLLSSEVTWKNGTVTVSDFKVEDLTGPVESTTVKPTTTEAPTGETQAPTAAPTAAPTVAPTVAPTKAPVVTTKAPEVKKLKQVKGVKVKSVKKKTIKVSWKKVANAKKYQVQVNKKKYKTSKTSRKINDKKFKKGKKIKVKVRATATGYKTGAWSKTKKFKIKK